MLYRELLDYFVENFEEENAEKWRTEEEAHLRRFQRSVRTGPGSGLGVIHLIFWPRLLFYSTLVLRTLSQVKFKSNKLICLAEEISRQENIQASSKKVAVSAKATSTVEEESPVLYWNNRKAKPYPSNVPFNEDKILVR